VEDEAAGEHIHQRTDGSSPFAERQSFDKWEQARDARIDFEAKIGGGV
jgi:hypothetical protein